MKTKEKKVECSDTREQDNMMTEKRNRMYVSKINQLPGCTQLSHGLWELLKM